VITSLSDENLNKTLKMNNIWWGQKFTCRTDKAFAKIEDILATSNINYLLSAWRSPACEA